MNSVHSNLKSLYSTYRITYENVGNCVEYLFTCIHPTSVQLYDIQVEVPEKERSSWSKCPFSSASLTMVSYFILSETSPIDVVTIFECCLIFPVTFFSQDLQMFGVVPLMTSKGAQGTESRGLAC